MRALNAVVAAVCLTFALSLDAQILEEINVTGEAPAVSAVKPSPASARGELRAFGGSHTIAPTTVQWIDGGYSNTFHYNCITGSYEALTGEWVGYYGNTDATSPKIGDIYYTHIAVGTVGNACAGVYANLQITLPPYTYLAISQSNPVYCFLTPPGGTASRDTADCPQSLTPTGNGGYYLNPLPSSGYAAWPLPLGGQVEIQVPVYSIRSMSGIATNSYLTGGVQAIDGAGDPWDYPNQGVFVAPNPPTISYTAPSATNITDTTAHTTAQVYDHYVGGDVYFDIGTSTAYGSTSSPFTIDPDKYNGVNVYSDWSGLAPGTTYHWRARFVTASGTTVGADQSFTTTGTAPAHVVEDFNADGKSDILLQNSATGDVAEWQMNGMTVMSGAIVASPGTSWVIVGTGDFNGDGKADIVLQNSATGNVAAWLMNGSVVTSGAVIGSPGTAYKVVGTGDFNGDGKSDVVLQNTSTGDVAVWLMNGTTVTSGAVAGAPGSAYKVVAVGDLNGDLKTDIVLQNNSTGDVAAWLMNGTSISGGAVVSTPGLTWKVIAAGDVNADGKSDLVLQNSSTGNVAGWLMNGTTVTSGGIIGAPGTSYVVLGTADYNGDGKSDVLLRQTTTGNIAQWQLNGLTVTAGGVVSSPGTNWKPVVK